MEKYVWIRDDHYTLISETGGQMPQLFDLKEDPKQLINIAADCPKIVKEMYEYAVKDAGGPLPRFDYLPSYLASETYTTPLTRNYIAIQEIIDQRFGG